MTALLTLEGVSKTFVRGRSERKVLVDASLCVYPGQLVTVFGMRCAGKTTLLRIAAGFELPDAGTVTFDGRDLAELSASSLAAVHREDIAWVDRVGPGGAGLTMLDYVGLPLLLGRSKNAADRMAARALEATGAGDCGSALWSDLSDVERAQVAVAHGLVRDPRLIVLDDPTAGLDLIDRGRILALLQSMAQGGAGVLMAVPDVPSMVGSHEVFSLSGGRLLGRSEPTSGESAVLYDFPERERSG